MFKTFVINLDHSTNRLAFMDEQLTQLGIDFERVPAVNGRKIDKDTKTSVYNSAVAKKKYYRALSDGEIGCYLSHIRCWEKIIADKLDFALILEDDVKLDESLVTYIQCLSSSVADWDYINLSSGHNSKKFIDNMKLTDKLSLQRGLKMPSTAAGQLISFSGAQKLLSHTYPLARPVDVDLQHWFERTLRWFSVNPLPVVQNDFESDINKAGNRKSIKSNGLSRFRQKIYYEFQIRKNRSALAPYPKLKSS